jgi:AraC-like DNA-binding protein
MLLQPSSLSLLVYRLGDTLKAEYDIDPLPIYEEFGIDPDGPKDAGERQPNSVVTAIFDRAAEVCGDPALGIKVGMRSEVSNFFVIGHVWVASDNLVESLEKLIRYEEILNSGDSDIQFEKRGDLYVLSEAFPNPCDYPGKVRADVEISSVLRMCEIARGLPVRPHKLDLFVPKDSDVEIYRPLVRGPIETTDQHNALYFSAADLEAPLSGSIPDLVEASCRIADRYIASLDSSRIAHQVRAQLVQMLPSGSVDQGRVASKLYVSASTLQRHLSAEGTSYRDVLDETRRELAEAYLRDGKHSHSQTAFLVGFSDQSNFSRAFKRWTGMSPGQYQKAHQAA